MPHDDSHAELRRRLPTVVSHDAGAAGSMSPRFHHLVVHTNRERDVTGDVTEIDASTDALDDLAA